MRKSDQFVWVLVAFLSGTALSERFLKFSALEIALVEFGLFGVIFFKGIYTGEFWSREFLRAGFFRRAPRSGARQSLPLNFFLFLMIAFVSGVLRFAFSFPAHSPDHVSYFNDQKDVLMRGVVVLEPDRREFTEKLVVDIFFLEISRTGENFDVKGRVLLSLPRYPEHDFGDVLAIQGELQSPDFAVSDDSDFSYKNYLARYNIYSVMYRAQVEVLEKGKGRRFYASIYLVKERFEERLRRIFPEPHASFAAGLLLGSRRSMPEHLIEGFNITGLTHIVAISGYNITLVIVFITGLLRNFSRRYQVVFSSFAIVLFTILVGASAAVVRAAIMGILGLFALWTGRKSEVLIALITSTFFITLWNPKILVYDVGFHLSFASTFGLIYISPYMKKWLSRVPNVFALREAFAMTLSAQITAVPIILMNFERFSFIAPIANVFAAPFIPLSMFFGAISAILSFFSEFLGVFVGYIAWFWLSIIIQVAEILKNVPYASVEFSGVTGSMLVMYYAMLWFFGTRIMHRCIDV